MPDDIAIIPKSESTPVTSEHQTVSSCLTQLVSLCALGLGVSFFLPWANVLFMRPSGFDLQKDGNEQLLLWLIPVFCVITIITGFSKIGQHIAARITGVLPFLVGAYWYSKIGSDLFHILTYGAFLSLGFGAAMIVLARKSK